MMWGYGYNGWGWMWLVGAVVLVCIVVLVVILVRNSMAPSRARQAATTGSAAARHILDERYARGELTAEEYREMLKNLGGGA